MQLVSKYHFHSQDDAHRGRGLGTTDGTFGSSRYFFCDDMNGLFVALDKISPEPFPTSVRQPKPTKAATTVNKSHVSATATAPTTSPLARSRANVTSHVVEQESSADPPKSEPCQFKIDERVMVFNKQGKEVYGRVRWYGDRTKTRNFGFTAVGIATVSTQLFL